MIVADLLTPRATRKTVGDLLGEPSQEAVEAEITSMLADCAQTIRALQGKLADVRAKFVGNMSPASKAALDVMGADIGKQIHVAEHVSNELQKRRIAVRTTQARSLAKNGYVEAVRDLAVLKEHAAAITAGTVRVDEGTRRRLVAALGVAQMRVAESA